MSEKHVAELEAAFEKIAFEGAESGNLPVAVMAQMSQAISLKRIADILEDVVREGAPINVDHRP